MKKGCDALLEVFAQVRRRHPDLHLIMAGPDQQGWAEKLQQRARKLGVHEHITWPGMLNGDLKWGAFHAAEVFVLPSHQENFGIAVAEALACGLPVLISDKVNICREIEEDGAGFIAADTVAGTQHNAERWLNLPVAEQASMRARARSCFHRRFHIEEVAARLANHLREIG
jgi:glycosyltransferase involved in cell wall biosynthesis